MSVDLLSSFACSFLVPGDAVGVSPQRCFSLSSVGGDFGVTLLEAIADYQHPLPIVGTPSSQGSSPGEDIVCDSSVALQSKDPGDERTSTAAETPPWSMKEGTQGSGIVLPWLYTTLPMVCMPSTPHQEVHSCCVSPNTVNSSPGKSNSVIVAPLLPEQLRHYLASALPDATIRIDESYSVYLQRQSESHPRRIFAAHITIGENDSRSVGGEKGNAIALSFLSGDTSSFRSNRLTPPERQAEQYIHPKHHFFLPGDCLEGQKKGEDEQTRRAEQTKHGCMADPMKTASEPLLSNDQVHPFSEKMPLSEGGVPSALVFRSSEIGIQEKLPSSHQHGLQAVLRATITALHYGGGTVARLVLYPESLGTIVVHIQTHPASTQVQIVVTAAETLSLVERSIESLQDELNAAGVAAESITVRLQQKTETNQHMPSAEVVEYSAIAAVGDEPSHRRRQRRNPLPHPRNERRHAVSFEHYM
ncbi:MAG: flagellar hook-length control protein FliK [Candidatus Kapabacteria bacterium]|nr:flagellar hook-length control protein FliK [Candidatus Kapabacteria bacterium]